MNSKDSPFFLTLKNMSEMWVRGRGSSITNSTLSREALANRSKSLKSNVQYCLTFRPSTLARSPPNIHWRPGLFRTKGCKNTSVTYRHFQRHKWLFFRFFIPVTKAPNEISIYFYHTPLDDYPRLCSHSNRRIR